MDKAGGESERNVFRSVNWSKTSLTALPGRFRATAELGL